jgi:hypothetical protein
MGGRWLLVGRKWALWQLVCQSHVNWISSENKMVLTSRRPPPPPINTALSKSSTHSYSYNIACMSHMYCACYIPALLIILLLINSVTFRCKTGVVTSTTAVQVQPTVLIWMPEMIQVSKFLDVPRHIRDVCEGRHFHSVWENSCFLIFIPHPFLRYLSPSSIYSLSACIPHSFPTCFICFRIGSHFPLPSYLSYSVGKCHWPFSKYRPLSRVHSTCEAKEPFLHCEHRKDKLL